MVADALITSSFSIDPRRKAQCLRILRVQNWNHVDKMQYRGDLVRELITRAQPGLRVEHYGNALSSWMALTSRGLISNIGALVHERPLSDTIDWLMRSEAK
jgi:hypothetical protein